MNHQRIHERQEHALEVVLLVDKQEDKEEIHAKTLNVSQGGMFILSTTPLEHGLELSLRITFPAMKSESLIPATVRWTTAEGVGVQFKGLRAIEAWAINQLLKEPPAKQ